ncbi:MAG: [FeFe] hydrogenase H-cluster maturation GTPase HydF [Candidatus Velamenicoccus archaeovorus]
MQKTPKSLRLHIGLFGRTNVGKSSFLNYVVGQDVAITSHIPGTTTDVVEKPMELLPIGPVVFLDTAGLDDASELGALRIERTKKVFDRCDVLVLLTEPEAWGGYEDEVLAEARKRRIPVVIVVNKADTRVPSADFMESLRRRSSRVLSCSCLDRQGRDPFVHSFKAQLIEICPEEFLHPPALVGDLLAQGKLCVFIVPIDKEAPKGRLILPQVQAIRDVLDGGRGVVVVRESEYASCLKNLRTPPSLVVCDSQVVARMVEETPPEIPCTTFSILFSRSKGDLDEAVRGAGVLDQIQEGDKVLIAEACSHHAIQDDIGRVKIPRWLSRFKGFDVPVEVCAGKDFPENLKGFRLVIHCGACMFTRREMLARIERAREQGVALTNYGVAIAYLQGVLPRVLGPFPSALLVYQETAGTPQQH